jgi:hypothetical protein
MTEMMEIAGKDFKIAIAKMFKNLQLKHDV